MSEIGLRPWRCDITGNPVGTDTVMVGAPPCDCQGCRAANENDRLREALEPFATCWTDEELDGAPDDMAIGNALEEGSQPTVGDLRRAQAALAKEEGK